MALVLAVAFLPVVFFVALVIVPSDAAVFSTALAMGAGATAVTLLALASPVSSAVGRRRAWLAVVLMVVQGLAFLALYVGAVGVNKSL